MRIGRFLCVAAALLSLGTRLEAQRALFFTYSTNTLSSTPEVVKAGPGPLLAMECYNPGAAITYVQVFDSAGAVTPGTTPSALQFQVNPGTTTGMLPPYANGSAYGATAGIQAAATTTRTGGAAPVSALVCDFFFR